MADLVEALAAGKAVLLATDTVYGVAAVAGSAGEQDIYRLKQRPLSQPLPWLVSGADQLSRWCVDIAPYARRLAEAFWPGALTLVLNASAEACKRSVAANGTVALRSPDNKRCLEVLSKLDEPVACTSANVHGMPAPVSLDEVDERFLALPHAADMESSCPRKMASTIVDCTGAVPRILRAGALDWQILAQTAQELLD